MELLILLALAVWGGARYSVNGAVAHARKAEPLRIAERRQRSAQAHERRMARVARRSARQGPTIAEAISIRIADRVANPRGGPAREALALWWADSWGYATERRRERHDRAAAGKLGRQKAARAVKGWAIKVVRQRRADGEKQESPQPKATTTGENAQPRASQPRTEQPRAEQSNPGRPRAEQPRPEQSSPGRPRAEQPRAGQPRAGQPRAERPRAEQPSPGRPRAEQQPSPEKPRADRVWADSEVIKVEVADDIVDAELVEEQADKAEDKAGKHGEGEAADADTESPAGQPAGDTGVEEPAAGTGSGWYHVAVEFPGGERHLDGIRADSPEEAQDKATRNWITDSLGERAERITILGPGDGPWTGPERDFPAEPSAPSMETQRLSISPVTAPLTTPNGHHGAEGADGAEHADTPLASVHPIRKESPTMTTTLDLTSGETLDPHAGKALAEQLRDIAAQCVSTVEQSSSSLQAAGVSGSAVDLLARLLDTFTIAASTCEEVGDEFARHQGIQDQVLSDPSLAGTVSGSYLGRA